MTEKKDTQKEFNTCLEDIPCAEMMHKLLGQKGVGSLCADMMKKMREQHGEGSGFTCAEMMSSMMKGFHDRKAESTQTKKEEGHD